MYVKYNFTSYEAVIHLVEYVKVWMSVYVHILGRGSDVCSEIVFYPKWWICKICWFFLQFSKYSQAQSTQKINNFFQLLKIHNDYRPFISLKYLLIKITFTLHTHTHTQQKSRLSITIKTYLWYNINSNCLPEEIGLLNEGGELMSNVSLYLGPVRLDSNSNSWSTHVGFACRFSSL